jgi:choline dehydrogenase-like flavoprotein
MSTYESLSDRRTIRLIPVKVHVKNRQIAQPRGRVVGGSTAMNFSMIMYPTEKDRQ